MRICVYGAASENILPVYMEQTECLGRKMAQRGHGLVFGGGAHGLMGAVARGVDAHGGEIIGVAPDLFRPDGILYAHCTRIIYTRTMRQRKARMESMAKAFVMVPGGVGTFDEFFEILTLKNLGFHEKPIAILNINHFFDELLHMLDQTMERGFIRPTCKELYGVFEDPDALLDYLEDKQK